MSEFERAVWHAATILRRVGTFASPFCKRITLDLASKGWHTIAPGARAEGAKASKEVRVGARIDLSAEQLRWLHALRVYRPYQGFPPPKMPTEIERSLLIAGLVHHLTPAGFLELTVEGVPQPRTLVLTSLASRDRVGSASIRYRRARKGVDRRGCAQQMANYRLEAALDATSGLYRAHLFYPADSLQPIASTLAIYPSEQEALNRIEQVMRAAFAEPAPGQPDSGGQTPALA